MKKACNLRDDPNEHLQSCGFFVHVNGSRDDDPS